MGKNTGGWENRKTRAPDEGKGTINRKEGLGMGDWTDCTADGMDECLDRHTDNEIREGGHMKMHGDMVGGKGHASGQLSLSLGEKKGSCLRAWLGDHKD